jgi:hypothetical protein
MLLNVMARGTYSYPWALTGYRRAMQKQDVWSHRIWRAICWHSISMLTMRGKKSMEVGSHTYTATGRKRCNIATGSSWFQFLAIFSESGLPGPPPPKKKIVISPASFTMPSSREENVGLEIQVSTKLVFLFAPWPRVCLSFLSAWNALSEFG